VWCIPSIRHRPRFRWVCAFAISGFHICKLLVILDLFFFLNFFISASAARNSSTLSLRPPPILPRHHRQQHQDWTEQPDHPPIEISQGRASEPEPLESQSHGASTQPLHSHNDHANSASKAALWRDPDGDLHVACRRCGLRFNINKNDKYQCSWLIFLNS
jgi:hypothetical protein